MKGVLIQENMTTEVKEYGSPTYKALGEAVSGFFEIVRVKFPGIENAVLIVNDEGAINGMDINPIASVLYGHIICGPVILLKEGYTDEGPDIISLDSNDICLAQEYLLLMRINIYIKFKE